MNYYHPTTLEHIRNPLPAVEEWAKSTAVAVPDYDPATQQCRFVDGAWAVETPSRSDADIIKELTAALESHYDTEAQKKNYDNRFTCALRAGYAGPFQAEGVAFATWMDSCNAYGYQVIADVKGGKRTVPTAAELLAELPTIEWPV